MAFTLLSKEQYEALDIREQVKYELQKEQYDKDQRKAEIAEAVKNQLIENKQEMEKLIEAIKQDNQKEIEAIKLSNANDVEKLESQLKRAKVAEIKERLKGMSELIEEKLSTDEGTAMLKAFANGQREQLNMEVEAKAMSKPTANGGAVAPQFTPIVGEGHDTLHMRDVIPTFPTLSDVVKFVQMKLDTSKAGIGTVAEGAEKPEMNYIPTPQESTVRKIAGLLDITDEMLEDVVGLRAWLAYELPKAYLDAEDAQILKGDGTGQNLKGIYTTASALVLPKGSVTAKSNTWDKIMAGVTEVRERKRNTTAVFVSPVDYMELFINKDNDNGYTYPIIMDSNGTLRAGGVPIYWTNVLESGEGLVGDFARGVAIFQRKAMVVAYSGEHKDNFAKNIQTIRIEGRIALVIFYPESFVKLDLTKPDAEVGG